MNIKVLKTQTYLIPKDQQEEYISAIEELIEEEIEWVDKAVDKKCIYICFKSPYGEKEIHPNFFFVGIPHTEIYRAMEVNGIFGGIQHKFFVQRFPNIIGWADKYNKEVFSSIGSGDRNITFFSPSNKEKSWLNLAKSTLLYLESFQ